jgi:hypothetical protein
MANIFRGPLYVGRREFPPVLSLSAIVVQSLLTSTLAVAVPAAPPGAHWGTPLVDARARIAVNANTSAGMPKTLYADKQLPVRNPAWVPPGAQPRAGWLPANTSAGTALGLKTVIVPPPAGTVAPFLGPQRFWWQPPNDSRGTPKTLIFDAQLPVRNPPIPLVDDWRAVTDTSRGTPVELFPVIAAALPPGTETWVSVPTYLWKTADTSAGTPKTLIRDAQAPVFNPAWVPPNAAPVAGWIPANTSAGTALGLKAVIVPVPVGTVAPFLGPQRFWWQPPDESCGMPKTLFADAQLPIRNPIYNAPDLVRSVVNTAQSAYPLTHVVVLVPLPPGDATPTFLPQWTWINANTTVQTNFVLPPILPPPTLGPPPDVSKTLYNPNERLGTETAVEGDQRLGTDTATGGDARLGGSPPPPRTKRIG